MYKPGIVRRVAGPVVVAKAMAGAQMHEVVRVGELGLVGEIIGVVQDTATIQVYEETAGIKPGEKVERTGGPLSLELGPGIVGQIYDGIQRPLTRLRETTGPFVRRGVSAPPLDPDRKWTFKPTEQKGAKLVGGNQIGVVEETPLVKHRILVPPDMEGTLTDIVSEGAYAIKNTIGQLETRAGMFDLHLYQHWPARKARPIKLKMPSDTPLLTGQRIIDFFFPIAKGGTAAIPGGFGTGKTVMLHSLSQWAAADIVVYVGCGERGNELAEVLEAFPELKDPRTGHPLMARTILVANTSNMPIAAREASVYTGITIAEYFRDMGYDVALMADSTSRWAEALREISGRLEEMPGEEGYPAYLASKLAEFYERTGRVQVLGSEDRYGSISVVGAVSPPGADLSEPVTQNTLRIVKVFWALDTELAHRRHFPAINWLTSYSLYLESLEDWYRKESGEEWVKLRKDGMFLLQRDEELREIVMLVGPDALSESQRVTLEGAKMIKEDFLMQHAYHPVDSYCPPEKAYWMIKLIMKFHDKMKVAVEGGIPLQKIIDFSVKEEIGRLKIQPRTEFLKAAADLSRRIDEDFTHLKSPSEGELPR